MSMTTSVRPLRWGILGAATIARKNWRGIRNSGNGIVTAVASRDRARSQAFIDDCQREVPFDVIPRAFGSYREVVESPEVDAVYVPLPTALRKEWVIRAADAGKHVVCEKPCAPSLDDLREMLNACRRNGVQFMDGVMFVHSRRFQLVKQRIGDGVTVGEVRRIASQFTFQGGSEFASANIRADASLEPAGCLGDLGWYNIRFALEVLNGRMPESVTGRILSEIRYPNGGAVPSEFAGEMWYAGGVSAGFYCSFITELQQWAHVGGTRGQLVIDDFVLPYVGDEIGFERPRPEYTIQGCEFRMEPRPHRETVRESAHGTANAQEAAEFGNFAARVLDGKVTREWADMVWKNQRVMEACLDSARQGGKPVAVGEADGPTA